MPGRTVNRREVAVIVLFWTSLALLSIANRLLDPRGFGMRPVSPAGPIAFALVEAWLWAAATPVIFRLSGRYPLEKGTWVRNLPLLLMAGVVIALAMTFCLEIARLELLPVSRRRAFAFSPFRLVGSARMVNQLLVYFAVLSVGFAREYLVRSRERLQEAMRLEAEAARLRAQLSEARLDALRMQLNPHFLFNTLHAVSALVERDPAGVRRMIARLSELLRHTLDRPSGDEIPLREELVFLRKYFDIMETRFQGRLQVVIDVPRDVEDALVPNLVLQPMVENAFEHGIARSTAAGEVRVGAHREDDMLVLRVEDNGPGPGEETMRRERVGLANTRARLDQLYRGKASVALATAPSGGTAAIIRIPWHTTFDLRTTAVIGEETP